MDEKHLRRFFSYLEVGAWIFELSLNSLILSLPKRRFMSKEKIMNAKKYLIVGAIVLNTVLLAFAASFSHHRTSETRRCADDLRRTALSGPSGKFGPVIETILP